jgi:hypothetical protein
VSAGCSLGADVPDVSDLPRSVLAEYLALVDGEAPGLVEGLYLVGSAVLDAFHPHSSDIDFVAVTAAPLDAAAVDALDRVHRRWRRRPALDGIYVTWSDLETDPAWVRPGGVVHGRGFRPGGGAADPVTWHTLARHGRACRGPAPAALAVWADADRLAEWTDDNLDRYWRRLVDNASSLRLRWGVASLSAYAAVWIVTGVSRLHFTLVTGDITSKEGAARYAREVFGERWHRVIDESLRLRRADTAASTWTDGVTGLAEFLPGGRGRSLYRTPFARRRDVLAFADRVIVDAHAHHRSG